MNNQKHITICTSPDGEEFYEAYGPLTKDRSKATEFFTNEKTLRPPSRFGRNFNGFWECEKRAEESARKEYAGWTFRHEAI